MAIDNFHASGEKSSRSKSRSNKLHFSGSASISIIFDDFCIYLEKQQIPTATEIDPLENPLQTGQSRGVSQPSSEMSSDDGVALIDCPLSADLERFDIVKINRSGKLVGAHFVVLTTFEKIQAETGPLPHGQYDEKTIGHSRSNEVELTLLDNNKSAEFATSPDADQQYIEKTVSYLEILLQKFRDILFQRQINSRFFGSETKDFSHKLRKPIAKNYGNSSLDARLIRRIIKRRQQRGKIMDWEHFSDPSWDMLLDLTAAHFEDRKVSVTDLTLASGVPSTTALRWITRMERAGLIERAKDEMDGRRAWVELSDRALKSMTIYLLTLDRSEEAFI